MNSTRVRRWAPLLAAAVVVAIVVVGALVRAAAGQGEPAGGGAGPGSSGAVVSPAPGDPGAGAGEPTLPSADPPAGSRFTDVALAPDGRSLAVTFYGGVADCYDYRLRATETAERVTLAVVETVQTDRVACIDLAQEYRRTVGLAAPLGDRDVLERGVPQPLTVRATG